MKRLPIGIQTFEKIRTNNFYYVDKTPFVEKLSSSGGTYYFLSRPRRFGKSLFLDTISDAFLCKKELFKGLHIENNWDWDDPHPAIKLSFGLGVSRSIEELRETFNYVLYTVEQQYSLETTFSDLKNRFAQIIELLYKKHNKQVVILIDEYDKPILDNIDKPDLATELRDELKNYYSVIKDSDRYIRLCFITGVSKFSKVNLFSGLNNLDDITLREGFGEICGYTEPELYSVFEDRICDFDKSEVKKWYNGYSFLGEPVYNPFDILLLLESNEFKNYWFETGTPSFLIKMLSQDKYFIPNIENIEASEKVLGTFDIGDISIETLLFQTGYLTIDRVDTLFGNERNYILKYPNHEVKKSLTDYILDYLAGDQIKRMKNTNSMVRAMLKGEVDKLHEIFHSFFASIPADWYRKNNIAGYEGYYASIFYCYMTAIGLDVTAEDVTNQGRIDLTVKLNDYIFIMEFKVVDIVKDENPALAQIKERRYHEKYVSEDKTIFLIGVEFRKKDRNITRYEWEKV